MAAGAERARGFLASLKRQLALYRELTALNQRQGELISSGDEKGLLELLAVKQKLMDEIEELSELFTAERELLAASPRGKLGALNGEIGAVIAELEPVLRSLMEAETRDLEGLRARQDQQAEGMKLLEKGQGLVKAYKSQASHQPGRLSGSG